jgi:hypothetical protein
VKHREFLDSADQTTDRRRLGCQGLGLAQHPLVRGLECMAGIDTEVLDQARAYETCSVSSIPISLP